MRFNAFLPLEGLTRIASCCLIFKSETHDDPQSPRQTRRRTALHHPDSPRLLAPSPHPASHRLRRLRPRTRPLGLGLDRQLSRRTHQAAQPLRRTKINGPTVVAQLPETEGHLGAHLRVEPATLAPRRRKHDPYRRTPTRLRRSRIAKPGRPPRPSPAGYRRIPRAAGTTPGASRPRLGPGRYSRRQSALVVLATDPSGKRPRRSESRSDPVFAPV